MFIAIILSCNRIDYKNDTLKENVELSANFLFSKNNNIYIDHKNGVILVHGINQSDEIFAAKDSEILQIKNDYEIWVNQTQINTDTLKISDLLNLYKNNIPIEVPIFIKKKSDLMNNANSFILTFSKLPVFELSLNNIQKHPMINDNLLFISDPIKKYAANVKINTRGRGSINTPKKSYALYTDSDLSLYFKEKFGIFSKSNEYNLYSGYFDPSLIREKFAHDLFNMQIPNENAIHEKIEIKFFDLFIAGEYQGIYALTNTINHSDLKFEAKSKNEYPLLEMVSQNIYLLKKKNEDVLNDALNNKSGDLFANGYLHKNGSFLAAFANRNVLCKPEYIQFFDTNYSYSYLSTILAIQGVDNITNNINLAVYPPLNDISLWNKWQTLPYNMKIYYIPWDLDMSLGSIGWKKVGGFDINYNNFNILYNHDAIHSKLPYKTNLEDQASLMTCYTKNKDGRFKENFNEYWLKNKNKYFNGVKLKKRLYDLYEKLEENGAYSREFKRWYSRTGTKFSNYDIEQMMEWIDKRIHFIEKYFLKIETDDDFYTYKKEFSMNNYRSKVNIIDFDPTKAKLAIETKKYITGYQQNSESNDLYSDGSATILELYNNNKNNIAAVAGGFFEYWSNGKFVHYKDLNLNESDPNNYFYQFNTKMISGCSEKNSFPKDGLATIPIGILKINSKWYSSSDNFSDVFGWNFKGDYIIERVKVKWNLLNNEDLPIKIFEKLSPKINVFRSDAIDQNGSHEYLSKYINPKRFENNVVIYFNTFSEKTRTKDGGLEIVVENDVITKVTEKGDNIIPDNGFVLSLSSYVYKNPEISIDYSNFEVGKKLKYNANFINEKNQEVKGFSSMDYIRGKVQALVLNKKSVITNVYSDPRSPYLDSNKKIKNTVQYLDANFFGEKHPRTALCLKGKNWKLIMVEGRKRTSAGMKIDELSNYMLYKHKCDDAINFDGGSSANMLSFDIEITKSGTWWGSCAGVPRPVSDILVLKK